MPSSVRIRTNVRPVCRKSARTSVIFIEAPRAGGRGAGGALGGLARLTPFLGLHIIPRTWTRRPRSRAPGAFACPNTQDLWGRRRSRGRNERIARNPDEADLPAEEAPSRQGARLPRPHEDNRGPEGAGYSAGTGPEAADGLTAGRGNQRPQLAMLTRPQDFAALQSDGTLRSHPLLSVRFLRTDLETTRFGLSTGRKLGGAVVRNRVRRRLREALRVMAPSFQPGWDVLIIARPGIVDADHETLVGALRRVLARGGVLGGPAHQ